MHINLQLVSGKHDGYLPASEELSEGKEIDLFYTALKGETPREANCSLERTSVLKTSLRIRMGGPGGSHHCKYSKRNRSVILPSSTSSGQITKSPPRNASVFFPTFLPLHKGNIGSSPVAQRIRLPMQDSQV